MKTAHIIFYFIWVVAVGLIAVLALGAAVVAITISLAQGIGLPLAVLITALVVGLLAYLYAWTQSRITFEDRLLLPYPPSIVFRLLATNYFEQRAHRLALPGEPTQRLIEQAPDGPIGVGATAQEVALKDGRRYEYRITVTAYELDKTLALAIQRLPNSTVNRIVYDFTPLHSGTEVRMRSHVQFGWAWGFARYYWAPFHRRDHTRHAQLLRDYVEQQLASGA